MNKITELVTNGFFFIVMVAYMFGGIVGVVVAASAGEAVHALLSLIIPFYGAIYVVLALL